jgi:hypothetical protein
MKASTRRWVTLSALGLLALDLGAFAIAAPRARGWIESARSSGLARAGATAVRDLERLGSRGVEDAGFALLTHFTRRSGSAYAFILRSTGPSGIRAQVQRQVRIARVVRLERIERLEGLSVQCTEMIGPVSPASATEPACPLSSCPNSACPKRAAEPGTGGAPSSIGLPTSALRLTVE